MIKDASVRHIFRRAALTEQKGAGGAGERKIRMGFRESEPDTAALRGGRGAEPAGNGRAQVSWLSREGHLPVGILMVPSPVLWGVLCVPVPTSRDGELSPARQHLTLSNCSVLCSPST